MRYRYYEKNSTKKILTYCFYITLVFWFFATIVLGYQFLIKNSQKKTTKWWTFVEAIFNQVSYLPYLKSDWQSLFYQSFLFDACINYNTLNTQGLKGENCAITTQDYQTYYVSLTNQDKKRSDGQPRSLADVLFTYETVIKNNIWDIKALNTYKDIGLLLEWDKIKIVFPTSTTDNNFFFTYYILPKHVLEKADLERYKTIFAANPITSSCWRIAPKSKDNQSLVFDLIKCKDTNFAFYQIKNYWLFENFSKSVVESKNTLIDAYANQLTLDGYEKLNVIKSQILTLFFNTKSEKVKVRLRRALGGLINTKFYDGDYSNYLKKYQEPLLVSFFSDGSNIKEFINRLSNPEESGSIKPEDLRDSDVRPLKKSIQINGVERKFVFYTQKPENKVFDLEIKFSNQFDTIIIKDNYKNTFSPKKYKKTDKKVVYPLTLDKNLKEGLNQYTIQGTIKGKSYVIANIDLYLLSSPAPVKSQQEESEKTKIKIVYYNNLESNFAIKQLRSVLTAAEILDSFLFEQISSPEELEGKLVLWDYDIILNTINIGLKKDILKILTTDDPLINPSRYSNPQLNNLFKQYTRKPQNMALTQNINQIFGQDMPFVVLGYPYDFVNVKSTILGTGDKAISGDLYEYNRRNYLYRNTTLVQSTVIDFAKLKDIKGFLKEIISLVMPETLNSSLQPEQSAQNETVQTWNNVENNQTQPAPQAEEKKSEAGVQTLVNPDNIFEGLVNPL